MCLYAEHATPKIAEEDILVLKVLHRIHTDDGTVKFVSPFRYFKYEVGVEYTSKLNPDVEAFSCAATVEEGLHSFVYDKSVINEYHKPYNDLVCVVVAEAIIPKGSEYFVGTWIKENKSIASNKLRIVKILD